MKKLINFILNLFRRKKIETVKNDYAEYQINNFDIELFKEINEYRRGKGLPFLEYGCEECFDIAGSHVEWLSENVSSKEDMVEKAHYYFTEREQQIKLRIKAKYVSETVAYDFRSAVGVVFAWHKSYKHNKVLNNSKFTHVVFASKDKFVIAVFYGI